MGVLNRDIRNHYFCSLSAKAHCVCVLLWLGWRSDHISWQINAENQSIQRGSHTFQSILHLKFIFLNKPQLHESNSFKKAETVKSNNKMREKNSDPGKVNHMKENNRRNFLSKSGGKGMTATRRRFCLSDGWLVKVMKNMKEEGWRNG